MTADVARILGLSDERVRQLADRGELPVLARTSDGTRLFDPADVEQLRQRRDQRAEATGDARAARAARKGTR